MLGLAGRKSNRVGWIGLSVFGGLLGLFFLMMFIPFLLPVYMVGIFGFVGWAFWRGTNLFGGTNNDIAVYAKYFAEQDPETQQLGKQAISTRSGDTEETSYPVDPKNPHTRLASFLPGPPLSKTLTTQMWEKHGEGIMGREIAMMTLAKEAGVPLTPWVQTGQALEYPVPTALVDAGKNAEFYQQRNLINLDDPIYPVNIVDLVLFGRVIQNNKPVLSTLQTFTYLETWFPSDHWLTLYPKTRTSLNRWGGLGEEIEATARQFNKVFDVQTDDTNWARLVLNPAVMKTLIDLAPLRFTVDAGRIVLHTHNGWLAVSEAKKYVGVLRDIARSVRAAETG